MNSEDESSTIVSTYPVSDYTKKAYRLINKIRENPEAVKQAIAKRLIDVDFTNLLKEDAEYRKLTQDVEALKARRNKVSSDIPKLKKEGFYQSYPKIIYCRTKSENTQHTT